MNMMGKHGKPLLESTVYHDCWGLIPWFIIRRFTMVYTILSFNICPVQMAIGSVPHFQTTVWSWGDVDGGNVPKLAMKYLLYDVVGCSV